MHPVMLHTLSPWQRWLGTARGWWFAAISSRVPRDDAEDDASSFVERALISVDEFEVFFTRHEGQITGYLRRIVGDDGIANDLCQETFVRAWQHYARISVYPRPETWLFRVATNLALNHLRRLGSPVAAATPFDDETLPHGGDLAEQVAATELVHQTLLALAPRARALLVLREVYGLTLEEAAHALGMSVAAAKKMLYRARLEFRRRYTQQEGH
jgi:RNA polymerase sigma-70 factor, ECF subfamily